MAFKTALVVDDSKSARFALRRFLENQYYKVETAASADECYVALAVSHPDVVFLDHVMPGADGFEVLKQIKADPATTDLKVVICTSNESPEFARQAIGGGAAGVLHKPPSPEQLTQILDNLYKLPAAAAAAAPSVVSKVANIREPDVAIEQRVMNTLRNTLSSPPAPIEPAPASNGLNQVAQNLSAQIAQLQAQAVQLQSRIHEEHVAGQKSADLEQLSSEMSRQSDRISALEQLVDDHFSELHAALEAALRAQNERIDQIVAAAGERAREEAERTVMNAAARISDQLANSTLTALRSVAFNPLAPRNPAESSPSETTDRRQA